MALTEDQRRELWELRRQTAEKGKHMSERTTVHWQSFWGHREVKRVFDDPELNKVVILDGDELALVERGKVFATAADCCRSLAFAAQQAAMAALQNAEKFRKQAEEYDAKQNT